MSTATLRALPYWGGKGAASNRPTGRWVAAQLPTERVRRYVEPFCGMCGVLLQRQPTRFEIVNDANQRLVTWWRVVRTRPDELAALIEATPVSRAEYEHAGELIETTTDDLEMAWCVTVLLTFSYDKQPAAGTWIGAPMTGAGPTGLTWHRLASIFHPLAERMSNVILECADGVQLVEDWLGCPDALLYLDPPYMNRANAYYMAPDYDRLLKALSVDVEARVAISGGEHCPWDELGWRRTELDVSSAVSAHDHNVRRAERLWMNYEPVGQQVLL